MIISELIEELSKYDSDMEVVLSMDSEGNGFEVLWDVTEVMYDTRYKEIFEPEDKEMLTKDCVRSIVLWP